MPIVQIQMLEGRTQEQKREIIAEMTETLSRVSGAPKESIRIIIQEIAHDDWGIAGMTMKEYRAQQNK